MRELIVDNFAGGGGASTGIEMAIGRSVDIAINHDENAVAMHRTNHPDTLHYCESVFDVSPVSATSGKPVGLAWFSPDCRHFSKAKGAKPVEKAIRGLAWIVIRWALDVGPRVMMLENVEEFKTWGPLLAAEMRPDPARVGETFRAFVGMLTTGIPADHPALVECCEFLELSLESEQAQRLISGLGYDLDCRELRASDLGTPTIRKRFFMVMRRDNQPIVWPEATHGDPKSAAVLAGKLAPFRTAAECIDWSIAARSIFDRKRPLAENTLKRIARGIQRFVIDSADPFIVKCNHTTTRGKYDCFRGQELDEPLQTITKTHGFAVAVPHLTKFRTGATGQPVTDPVPTVTAGTSKRPGGNGHALGVVEAELVPFLAGNGGSEYQAKPRPLDKPAHTILKESRACIVAPVIARQFGASIGHRADEPSATITAGGGGKSQLVVPTLIQMGYAMWISAAFNLKVIRTFDALQAAGAATVNADRIQAGVILLESAARMLNLSNSSKLGAYQKLQQVAGLPDLMPSYAIDAPAGTQDGSSRPTLSLSALLKANNIRMTANQAYHLMAGHGIVEQKERRSRTGINGVKRFWSVTAKGCLYGKNITSPANPRETQPHFFESKFPELLKLLGIVTQ